MDTVEIRYASDYSKTLTRSHRGDYYDYISPQKSGEVEIKYVQTEQERTLSAAAREWDNNPASRWAYNKGAEGFKGHDIMIMMLDLVETSPSEFNPGETVGLHYTIDEYGYQTVPPANYTQRPGSSMLRYNCEDGMFLPMNSTTSIITKDTTNLRGLTLDERKTVLDKAQAIIDKNGLNVDAKRLSYESADGKYVHVQSAFRDLDRQTEWKLTNLFASDKELASLVQKAALTRSGYNANTATTQEYTIKVTGSDGKRLPNDQILIEAGDRSRQIQMSVKEFESLDRKQITERLLGA